MNRRRLASILVVLAVVVAIAIKMSREESDDRTRVETRVLAGLPPNVRISKAFLERMRECKEPRSVVLLQRARPTYCRLLEERFEERPRARRLP